MVLADLPSSDGEAIAKEMGDNATFVATDVSGCGLILLHVHCIVFSCDIR